MTAGVDPITAPSGCERTKLMTLSADPVMFMCERSVASLVVVNATIDPPPEPSGMKV